MARFNRTIRALLTKSDGTAFAVNTAAYTANDSVGANPKMYYGSGGGALMRGISIRDTHKQNEPYIIHVYRSNPSTLADAAPMADTVADGDLEIAQITVAASDYVTANGTAYSKAYIATDINIDEESAGYIYFRNECTATPDYNAATDVAIEGEFWIE